MAIGASTGGTEAIREVLMRMPANSPAIVVVQHIPPVFSALCRPSERAVPMEVQEAEDGDLAGRAALIAPGDFHMTLRKRGGATRSVRDGPRVCYQRPSVDVLFAPWQAAGAKAVGAC